MAGNYPQKRKCPYCEGTGKYKKPNDEEYKRRLDYHEDKAYFISTGEAREKALTDVGYTLVVCPECSGTGTVGTVQEA